MSVASSATAIRANNAGYHDYKDAKEAFVSQLEGGTISRINSVSLTALTTYLFWAALRSRGLAFVGDTDREHFKRQRAEYKRRRGRRRQLQELNGMMLAASSVTEAVFGLISKSGTLASWLLEFTVLVVPIVLACTTLSEHLGVLNGSIALISTLIVLSEPSLAMLSAERSEGSSVQTTHKDKKKHWAAQDSSDEDEERREVDENAKLNEDRLKQSPSATRHVRYSSTHYLHLDDEPPLRVSVDAAGDAAHAAAAPPTTFFPPGANAKLLPSSDEREAPDQRANAKEMRKIVEAPASSLPRFVPRSRSFLTIYRAHMMLMTILCILAVDFPAFPREFAKCETWGTSLMDLGVGSFVFSLGIVSAFPMLRSSPQHRFKPMRYQLVRDARRSFPLLVLGSIRVIMVKGVDYPEHVAEYGVHWNFFITLALLPFLGTLGRPMTKFMRFSSMGLSVLCAHQLALSFTPLGSWASSNDIVRQSLVSQNKEGLVSLPGYAAIYLLGLDLGHYLLPSDPYLAYRRLTHARQHDKLDKLALLLVSFASLWWGAFYLQRLVFSSLQVSRRLANLPYVFWITAYNTSFLLAYVGIYAVLLQPVGKMKQWDKKIGNGTDSGEDYAKDEESKTPLLFRALNEQAFAVFLLANLVTGLVNMSMQTMYASNGTALTTLVGYLFLCLGTATIMYWGQWRLKI